MKNSILKIILVTQFLLLFVANSRSFAQVFDCYPSPAITDSSITSFTTPCVPTSPVFHSFYKYQQNYIPENDIIKALSVHKDINIVINIINPSVPGPIVNYQNTTADKNYIKAIVDKMNERLSNIEVPSDPVTAACGVKCRVIDSRFRVKLKGIYFINSADEFDEFRGTTGAVDLSTLTTINEDVLNVFIVNQNEYSVIGGVSFTLPTSSDLLGGINAGAKNILLLKEYYPNKTNTDALAHNFLHEMGHAMGLYHNYVDAWGAHAPGSAETGITSDLDYLDDVFGLASAQIYPRPYEAADCSEPYDTDPNDECTNNLMAGGGYYLSPKQIGRMHRNAYFLSCRTFITNTYPEDEDHTNIGQGQKNPVVINNSELWDFDIKMYNDIIVKSGATLTITCKVQMPYHSNIIVEAGGNLIIDGGLISSHDNNTMWYGISVWGNSSKSQDIPGNQGTLTMKNGAKIENALHAAVMGDEVFNDIKKGGGIANIQNAYFYNNRHSIGFWEYHNRSGFVFKPNRSYIYNSSFLIDDGIQRAPYGQIQLWNVEGVKIMGCNLESKITKARSLALGDGGVGGRGILSSGAQYTVSDLCPDPLTASCTGITAIPSTIKGFGDGVLAEVFGLQNPVTIRNTNFNKNRNGVVTNNVNFAKVYNNKFEVYDPRIFSRAYGIYTYASTQFQIYLNDFNCVSDPEYNDNVALMVKESGSDDNKIYRNSFQKVNQGVAALGVNSNGVNSVFSENKGLQFLCNNYTNIYFHEWAYGSNATDHGIRYNQATPDEPTGNFHIGHRFFNLGQNGTHNYTYFYSSIPSHNPTSLFGGVTKVKLTTNNVCALPKIYEIPYGIVEDGSTDDGSAIAALMTAYNDTLSELRTEHIADALMAINSAYTDIDRSILWLQNGQIAKGLAIYDSISTKYTLLATEQAEFTIGRRVINLLAHHYQDSIAMKQLSLGEIDSLHYVIANSSMWPRAKACSWLRFAINEECPYSMPPSPPKDSNNFNLQRRAENGAIVGNEKINSILIVPNPTLHNFEVRYTLANDEDALMVVRDLMGNIKTSIILKGKNHVQELIATQWAAGLYFYTVLQGNNTLSNGKLLKY